MLIKEKARFTLLQSVLLIVLFLATMNFGGKYFYLVFMSFVLLFVVKKANVIVDSTALLILAFSVCLAIFSEEYSAFSGIKTAMRAFAFPMTYIVGYNFWDETRDIYPQNLNEKEDTLLQRVIIVVSMGAFFHYVLNWIINWGAVSRNTVDIWSGAVINATGQAAFCCIAIGVFSAVIFSEKKWIYKVFAIVGLIIVLAYNSILACRTSILLMGILLGVCFWNYWLRHREYHLHLIIGVSVLLLGIVTVISLNVLGIRNIILQSNLVQRFITGEVGQGARISRKIQYISYLLVYPFGGAKIRYTTGVYAHDILFDLYSEGGVITTLLLIVILIIAIRNVVWIIRTKELNADLKLLVMCVYFAIYCEFCLEPILNGVPWFFATSCFYDGMIARYLKKQKNLNYD